MNWLALVVVSMTAVAGQSRIALQAAAARAHTSHEPDPTVRNPDWLADPLLGPDEIALLDNHPIARAVNQDYRIANLDPDVVALSRAVLVRTRFFDERLQRALREGATQVVILNAGFDTRAYRFRALLEGKRAIEIDDAATQALKKRRVREVFGALPANVTYSSNLRTAGVRMRERTVFVWEGSVHRAESTVRENLRFMAGAARGSLVLMDFAWRSLIEKTAADASAPQTRWDRLVYGEPWVWGMADGESEAFFHGMKLEQKELIETNSAEAERRFLTRRDGTRFGPPPNGPGSGMEGYLGVVCVELGVE